MAVTKLARAADPATWRFTYVGYNAWIRELSLMALEVEPEEVWMHPRRFRGKPFVELIRFPDACSGGIGTIRSAKLHVDFVAFASRARKYYLNPRVSDPPSSQVKKEPAPIACLTSIVPACRPRFR